MYIEIESVEVRSETSKNGNQLRSQRLYLYSGDDKHPDKYWVSLGTAPPYEPGKYLLHADTFRPSRFGQLEIDPYNVRLVRLTEPQVKALLA